MNHYHFSSDVLVRTPLLGYQVSDLDYRSILKRADFRSAIFLASRSLYNEISKKQFDYNLLTTKQKQSIKKYVNRAAFRSTPFGMFSSVSLVNWTDRYEPSIILGEPTANVTIDFAALNDFFDGHLRRINLPVERFQTNPSFYFNKVDFRFIKKTIRGTNTKFSVVSVEKNPLLRSLLTFCKRPKSSTQILDFLLGKGAGSDEAKSFIQELIREQMIVSNISPNVTGKDYLDLLSWAAPQDGLIKILKNELGKVNDDTLEIEQTIHSLPEFLDQHLHKGDSTNYFYCISQRKTIKGGLRADYQDCIKEGLFCLRKLSSSLINKDLETFKKAFIKKYEGQEIPLLQALDPQFGIGYGGFDKIRVSYGFSSAGYGSSAGRPVSNSRENDLTAWFLNELKTKSGWDYELEISDQHLLPFKDAAPVEDPPSISVLFRTLGNKVLIESAGGVSALSLIGRFSVFEDIFQYAKQIAQQEQMMNKTVVFAEVAHCCNLHTANINRRPHFYDYEIPLLTNSVLPQAKQIQLGDLLVSVRDNEVVLRSNRLNKVVVPRLSSAFNYAKSDFPVFRFLCDLQSQKLKANLNFSLPSLIPGLKFYPRLRYKSCILQLAEWHLSADELPVLQSNDDTISAFRKLVGDMQLPRHFSYSIGDNFLVFDLEKKEDIELFLEEAKGKTHIVLKEFPFLSDVEVNTKNGERLVPQYMATLCSDKEVYHYDLPVLTNDSNESQIDTSEWVYFKVYCHPLSSDIILGRYVLRLMEKLKKEKLISKWFWVRYNDPDYHLRIRVKTCASSERRVFQLMAACFDKICKDSLGNYFQTDSYKREFERYSPQLIEKVEEVFQASSELIGGQLINQNGLNYEDQQVIIEAVLSTLVILDAFDFGTSAKAALCKKTFDQFFIEFDSPKELKSEMEKLYREVEQETDFSINYKSSIGYSSLINSVCKLVKAHQESKVQTITLEKLAVDIVHMHLNRLFIHEQRYFEMVHYYLLYRALNKQLYKAAC